MLQNFATIYIIVIFDKNFISVYAIMRLAALKQEVQGLKKSCNRELKRIGNCLYFCILYYDL